MNLTQGLLIILLFLSIIGLILVLIISKSKFWFNFMAFVLLFVVGSNVWCYFNSCSIFKEGAFRSQSQSNIIKIDSTASQPQEFDSGGIIGNPGLKNPLSKRVDNVQGQILNSRDLKPIANAQVLLKNDTLISDSEGKFIFPSIEITSEGAKMVIECPGFFEWTKNLSVNTDFAIFKKPILIKPKIRMVFPPFQIEKELGTKDEALAEEFPRKLKQSFVKCKQDIEVFIYDELPEVLTEFERVKKLGKLMDTKQLIRIGKMSSANFIVTGKIENRKDTYNIPFSVIELETGTIEFSDEVEGSSYEDLLNEAEEIASKIIASMSIMRITNFTKKDTVRNKTIDLEGIFTCIPNGYTAWIAVQPFTARKIYPQYIITDFSDNENTWNFTPVSLGNETTASGESFSIKILLTDKKANKIFQDYLEMTERTERYPGLDQPKEVQTKHQITLVVY